MNKRTDLAEYLENDLLSFKDDFKQYNKHCKDENSFLCHTHKPYFNNENTIISIDTYEYDLPDNLKKLLLESIKKFVSIHNLEVTFNVITNYIDSNEKFE